jgi:hypothetical protein
MAALENRHAELSARRSFQEETHMKWSLWAAVAIVSLAAGLVQAAEPRPAYSGANWWARYGTPPVSFEHTATGGPVPVTIEPAALPDHGGYGYDYVYYPGICDPTPLCTDWLWAGYVQNPKRCNPHFMRGCQWGNCNHCGNCGAGSNNCASCGAPAGDCGCSAAAPPAKAVGLAQPQPLPDIGAASLPRATLGPPRGHVR